MTVRICAAFRRCPGLHDRFDGRVCACSFHSQCAPPPFVRRSLAARCARAPEISMTKRMLIDANHPEETRVVVLDGSKVEEFDFEAASQAAAQRKHLSREGDARRAVAAGRLCRIWRQPPGLPGLCGNPSRLLPDPHRRPAGAAGRAGSRSPPPPGRRYRKLRDHRRQGRATSEAEAEEEAEEEADTGDEVVEMAPLVPLDSAPDSRRRRRQLGEDGTSDSAPESSDDEHEDVFVNHGGVRGRA